MFAFQTSRGGCFSCEADFSVGSYLNLHFFDAARERIVFHLSLRRDEGLVVVNRRDPQGWRRELSFPVTFGHRPVPVAVTFRGGRVLVDVDGRRVGAFDRLPRPDRRGRFGLRRGFPRLADIAHVDVEGAVVADSVLIDRPAESAQSAALRVEVNDAFEAVLSGYAPTGDAALHLRIAGLDDRVPAVALPLPETVPGSGGRRALAWVAVVPGRAWDAAGGVLDMAFVSSTDVVVGRLRLTRDALVQRIGPLVAAGGLDHDDRAALQAIEHVRHAGILPLLSDAQRVRLAAVAHKFRLADYLFQGTPIAPGSVLPVPEDPATRAREQADAAVNDFLSALRKRPGADPVAVVTQILSAPPRDIEARAAVLTALADWFSANGRTGAFVALWHAQGLPVPEPDPQSDSSQLSAALPLLFAKGAFWQVRDALTLLAERPQDWISAPVLGWLAARLADPSPGGDGPAATADQRGAILGALIAVIDGRARGYWERTTHLELIDGLLALLARAETLPKLQAQALDWMLVRNFGLVPSFWERARAACERRGLTLPPLLGAARQAFSVLRAAVPDHDGEAVDRAAVDLALRAFQQLGNVDYERARRDLLGPAGLVLESGEVPDLTRCLVSGIDPLDAAVRFAADPRIDHDALVPPESFRAILREGIAAAHDAVPTGPFAGLQAQVFRDASAVLHAPDPLRFERALQGMAAMADARGAWLGVGLAVSLVNGLLRADREAEAGQVTDRIEAMARTLRTPRDRVLFDRATAPAMAVAAMCRNHPGHPLAVRIAAALAPGAAGPDPIADRTADLGRAANPLLNTLVCLYSCQPNLATRVAAIRSGWMTLLRDMGLPCLVFVGGGDGQRHGDVVYLDAPDDYEGLPQKTLAMVRWVRDNTGFSHLHKIDDDCFLDPAAYHGSLAPLRHDYYGRPLTRRQGEMDRVWHMARSRSARGRLELDKSPEPSTYADGGTSYVLSRRAMGALLDAAASPRGQLLTHLSFMEDKLVGDLLALRGIHVSGEDHRCAILRRTHPGGPIVPQWDNGFLPFDGSGIAIAHLDGHEQQAEALAASRAPWPKGAKLWPSYQKARFGWCRNALDLVSGRDRLARVNEASVVVVTCLRNEALMLDHFLNHYRGLGIKGFLIADNGSDDGGFDYLAQQPDVALFSVDTDYNRSNYGVAWQQALMANLRPNRWSLVADADEFLFWNRDLTGSLPDLVAEIDAEGADAARVFMLDMYPRGLLEDVDFRQDPPFAQAGYVDKVPFLRLPGARGPFGNSPVWTSALRHRLIPGSRAELFVAQKYALLKYRPWMRLTAGLHYVAEARVARRELMFAHFKYSAAFRAKAQAEVARGQHFNDAEEYRKYLALLAEGRDCLFDPQVSGPWRDSDFVRARCD